MVPISVVNIGEHDRFLKTLRLYKYQFIIIYHIISPMAKGNLINSVRVNE